MEPPRRPGTQTAEQVAARFGVTLRTVYRWRRKGIIRGIREGNFLVFTANEVDRLRRERFVELQEEQDVAS